MTEDEKKEAKREYMRKWFAKKKAKEDGTSPTFGSNKLAQKYGSSTVKKVRKMHDDGQEASHIAGVLTLEIDQVEEIINSSE